MHPKYWKPCRLMSEASDGTTGSTGGGALNAFSAANAFEARLSDEPAAAAQNAAAEAATTAGDDETEEQAAERLAREDSGEPNAETKAAEPQKYTIKVDGKDVTLTAEEMADAYKGQMRDKDYRQKTMEAADVRKTADAEIAQARAQRDEYAGKLESFTNQANYEVNALKAQLTDELLHEDPVTYLATQRIVEKRQAELVQAHQELQQISQQRQAEHAEAIRQHLTQQQELLLAKLPEWKDPAKAKAEVTQLKEYLVSQGMTPEETDLTDHRAVIIARKAMQYDALMERARSATKKVASAPPKVERPGNAESARPGDGRTTAMKNLQKTGSISDAASALSAFL